MTPAVPIPHRTYTWSYGITTVVGREELFVKTKESLGSAGFDSPIVFLDIEDNTFSSYWSYRELIVVHRNPKITPFANWFLGFWELYLRNPMADFYAMFQDDIISSRNIKEYIEKRPIPRGGYGNLFTSPANTTLAIQQSLHGAEEKLLRLYSENKDIKSEVKPGWYLSDQLGRGAVALVFPRDAAIALLSSRAMLDKPTCTGYRSWKAIDGTIREAMTAAGFKEHCHYPSLTYHTGEESTLGNPSSPQTDCFWGEEYNIMEALR